MGHVTTVLGDIDADRLGFCQPHEHLYMVSTKLLADENPWFRLNNLPWTIRELQQYKAAGGGAVMDPNPMATGRYAIDMAEMARQSGVHIIACTGFHIPALFYDDDHWIMRAGEDVLRRMYVDELNEGMYIGECYRYPTIQTDIRAGALKAAVSCGEGEAIDEKTHVLLRTVGEAGVVAGASVMVHTNCGYGATEAVRILEKAGMQPEHIIICHVDRRKWNAAYYNELSEHGTYLEYDTINQGFLNDQEWITDLILTMIQKGHADRMLLSMDTMNDRLKAYGGKMGLDYILTEYIPLLRERGVSQEELRRIFVTNPARALERYEPVCG